MHPGTALHHHPALASASARATTTALGLASQPGLRPVEDEALLARFDYRQMPHGPEREVAMACALVADAMADSLPTSPHVTLGLIALLEARDAFTSAIRPAS